MVIISTPIVVMTADMCDLPEVFHNVFILIGATSLYDSFISLPGTFCQEGS